MTSPDDPRLRLADHLAGVAAYNDKGFLWSRHNADEIRAHRQEAQRIIDRLIADIGEAAFSADLLQKLRGGAAVTDSFGVVAQQARAELLRSRPGEDTP